MDSNSLCQLWGRDTDSLSLWDSAKHGGTLAGVEEDVLV